MYDTPPFRRLDDGTLIAACPICHVETPTKHVYSNVDEDGTIISSVAEDRCPDCQRKLEIRIAESSINEKRRRAKYEQSLANLIASVPQRQMDLGLD